jgi:predicted  nucleic acid-binding Zn-ribbon protein
MKWFKYLSVALMCLAIAACSRDKEPAEQALKSATEAVEKARAEGSKFASDQFKALEDQLKAAKEQFEKKEYTQALQAARGVAAKAEEVAKAAADKKGELTKAWQELESGIAQMMEAVKSRLDSLSAVKKLPKEMDKDKLAGLKSQFDEASKALDEAKSAAATELAKAIEAGQAVKAKLAELAAALGMQQQ